MFDFMARIESNQRRIDRWAGPPPPGSIHTISTRQWQQAHPDATAEELERYIDHLKAKADAGPNDTFIITRYTDEIITHGGQTVKHIRGVSMGDL